MIVRSLYLLSCQRTKNSQNNNTEHSLQHNLVCDDAIVVSHSRMIFYLGVLVGDIVFGWSSDRSVHAAILVDTKVFSNGEWWLNDFSQKHPFPNFMGVIFCLFKLLLFIHKYLATSSPNIHSKSVRNEANTNKG